MPNASRCRGDHFANADERALHLEQPTELGIGRPDQDRVLQLVDLVVEFGESREEAVDQAVEDGVQQHDQRVARVRGVPEALGERRQRRTRRVMDGHQVTFRVEAVHLYDSRVT